MPKDITVIIPTYNRHQHLSRLLTYYSKVNLDINFLVLDSSIDDCKNKNISFVNNFISKKILKVNYKSYSTSEHIINKIIDGLNEVNTKYCALCGDDDLIFIDTLVAAVSYLEVSKNIVCVDGLYVNFLNSDKRLKINFEYSRSSINSNNINERIFSLMQKYESLYYGVYRVIDFRLILRSASINDNLHFQELHQSIATLMLGKHHRLDRIYGARQHCEPADLKRENWQTIYWFSKDSTSFIRKYLEYRLNIFNFYIYNTLSPHISKAQFNQLIDVSHAIFLSKACDAGYMYESLATLWPEEKFRLPQNIDLKKNSQFFQYLVFKMSAIFNYFSVISFKIANSSKWSPSSEFLSKRRELEKYCALDIQDSGVS